jgi:uncharacterized protein YndB with AHSA1/START domain
MSERLVAKATITIDAPVSKVWNALVRPEMIRRYMFGTRVVTDWKEGSRISWRGTWSGKRYEDKGMVLEFKPLRMMRYSHYSPLTGLPDLPENYHTVTIKLSEKGARTVLSLSQDNNLTEEAREHSEKNWGMVLSKMKELLEVPGRLPNQGD